MTTIIKKYTSTGTSAVPAVSDTPSVPSRVSASYSVGSTSPISATTKSVTIYRTGNPSGWGADPFSTYFPSDIPYDDRIFSYLLEYVGDIPAIPPGFMPSSITVWYQFSLYGGQLVWVDSTNTYTDSLNILRSNQYPLGTATGLASLSVGGVSMGGTAAQVMARAHIPPLPLIPGRPAIPATPPDPNLGWNSGASSAASFSGPFEAEFTFGASSYAVACGISDGVDTDANLAGVKWGFILRNRTLYQIRNGVENASWFGNDPTLAMRLTRLYNGDIQYFYNGAIVHIEPAATLGVSFLDSSLYRADDTISLTKIVPLNFGVSNMSLPPLRMIAGQTGVAAGVQGNIRLPSMRMSLHLMRVSPMNLPALKVLSGVIRPTGNIVLPKLTVSASIGYGVSPPIVYGGGYMTLPSLRVPLAHSLTGSVATMTWGQLPRLASKGGRKYAEASLRLPRLGLYMAVPVPNWAMAASSVGVRLSPNMQGTYSATATSAMSSAGSSLVAGMYFNATVVSSLQIVGD